VIESLSRKYPRIVFHVVTTDAATLTGRELPDRNIEVAIGATPILPKDTVIEIEILFNERQVVMAGANVSAAEEALRDVSPGPRPEPA
jgi:DNA-binding transcriptional LysR family regulator